MAPSSFTVVQLSDIHWGAGPSPIDGRDPEVTFGHVRDHIAATVGTPDLFVATGDLTDDGSDAAASSLAAALGALGAPVHCLAGNHDSGRTLDALSAGHPGVLASSATQHGSWLFCYVDTNAGGVVRGTDGTRADHPDRMHRAVSLAVDPDDLASLERLLAASDAEHAMVWLHHPPLLPAHLDATGARSEEVRDLQRVLGTSGKVRAVAAGHLHTGFVTHDGGIAYHGAPTTWLGMDFERLELTAPGYRTFRFHADGRVESTSVLVEHESYPSGQPLPEWVGRVFAEHFGIAIPPRAG